MTQLLERDPVFCRGCGDEITTFDDQGLGGKLTDHNMGCDWHSFTGRCTHTGPCYEKRAE